MQHKIIDAQEIAIRFTGDSGDGMQLTGTLFADASALFGNEISTFPDYPAEIRAPQGTVAGVSGFQVHIGSGEIRTPGDFCDVLVAMNPAAFKANAKWTKSTASIILDADTFDEAGIQKAGFKTMDPVAEIKMQDRNIIFAPITSMTKESLKESGLDAKAILRCKNMFALGICYYLFNRPLKFTEEYFEDKFKGKQLMIDVNKKVLRDGFNYAANIQAIANTYSVEPAKLLPKGKYRNMNGNQATAWGLIAAAEKAGLPLFCGSYPITPATGILEELSLRKDLGVKTLQCEDEIAGICTSIGAAYAGNFAVTTTSGPGLSLKSEALGLAMITELPLVVVDVQRSGPSTGIPTKTEQTDLAQAIYGRNGECPIAIIAARSPSHCFEAAFYAGKYAMEHMMPVLLLTEGFLGNGSEPWLIPNMSDFPDIHPPIITQTEGAFHPFKRDEKRLARQWAFPGISGLEHRVGGLEKDNNGSVSSDPLVHERMVAERAAKVARLADFIPLQEVIGAQSGDILIVGWGGTYGHLYTALRKLEEEGMNNIGLAHFDYINPLPKNTAEVFSKFKKIIVCELNSGMFADYLRTKFPQYTYLQRNKVQGQPFIVADITSAVKAII